MIDRTDIFQLPQDISGLPNASSEDILFHYYNSPQGTFRGKSILNTNAISLVIDGTKTMHFANKTVNIKEGEFHFLSEGNCVVTMNLAKAKQFESILIFFGNKTLADFYLKYRHKIDSIKKNNLIDTEPYIAFKKDNFIESYIKSLQLFLSSSEPISTEMQLLKFEELMLYLLEKHPLRLLAFPLSKNRELEDLEIKKAVEVNITNNISLTELAFLCNLSLSTFKRRFENIYGLPPGKWFLNQRMEMAKKLIAEEGERPGEVYYKVGYENHSSFSQSFKQHFGVTPSECV